METIWSAAAAAAGVAPPEPLPEGDDDTGHPAGDDAPVPHVELVPGTRAPYTHAVVSEAIRRLLPVG